LKKEEAHLAVAEESCSAMYELKFCQLLHNYTRNQL